MYFSLFDEDGQKVEGGDRRLSKAPGFSVNVTLTWNDAEFIPVWQDERNGLFDLFAQRIDIDGNLDRRQRPAHGGVERLRQRGALRGGRPGRHRGRVATGDAATHFIQFRTFTAELEPRSEIVTLTTGETDAVYPTVVWNRDRYVIAWFDKSASLKAIYAAAVSEDGQILTPPTPISDPGPFRSRYPFLRPLGDRLLAIYSDDRDQNDGYELYAVTVNADLVPISAEQRLTFAPRDSIGPVATFGPEGDVGILFRDDREGGEHHVFFTRLGCIAGD